MFARTLFAARRNRSSGLNPVTAVVAVWSLQVRDRLFERTRTPQIAGWRVFLFTNDANRGTGYNSGTAFPDDSAMQCPFCRKGETKVVDSRTSDDFAVRRRRECLSCNRRFTTYERIEESPLKVIKKDGTRVPFDRERIRRGIEKACYKRPVSDIQIDELIGRVEADIYESFEREIPSRNIGELVFNALRELDQVAFVRFASVYREFKDVNDFVDELEPMLRDEPRS